MNYSENGTIVLVAKGGNFVSVLHVFRFIHAVGLVCSVSPPVRFPVEVLWNITIVVIPSVMDNIVKRLGAQTLSSDISTE